MWILPPRPVPEAAWEASSEVREVNAGSIEAWIAAVTAPGTATPDEIAAATAAARAQFTPDETRTDGDPTAD